jgi:hypothetical protein
MSGTDTGTLAADKVATCLDATGDASLGAKKWPNDSRQGEANFIYDA